MYTKFKQSTKSSSGIFLLLGIFFLTSMASGGQPGDFDDDCMYYGTVIDLSVDSCGYQIRMDNGTSLQLADNSVPDFFHDSLRIVFGFEIIDSISNQCGIGLLVHLTCCKPFEEPECQAEFEIYPWDYTVNDSSGFIGYSYSFIDVSSENVIERQWLINGDSIGNDSVLFFTFDFPGTNTVCLTIVTDEGCFDMACNELIIPGPPYCQAMFVYERIPVYPVDSAASDTIPYMAYVYQFYDRSEGKVIGWHWQFKNEVIDGIEDPVYEFPAPGNYDVCLTIITSDSCQSAYCETVYVGDTVDCRALFRYYCPVDTGTFEDDFPGSTLLHFIDMSEGNITQWHWDFGDSAISEEQHPFHEFPEPGTYEVCLTIFSPDGCEDTYCEMVTVGYPQTCNAYFEYCNYSSVNGNGYTNDSLYSNEIYAVGFKNLSTPEPFSSAWEFGDGSFSGEKNPVHIFTEPGYYNVCLTIYTPTGCQDTYCVTVNVGNASCTVDFTWELLVPDCSGYDIAHMFTPILEEEAWSYHWDFGDGYYSVDPIAAHIYTNEGFYDVCLDVFYEDNCAAKMCKTIVVTWENRDSIYNAQCNPSSAIPSQTEEKLSVLNIFPNPASDKLTIDLFSDTDRQITVQFINMLGKAVKRRTSYMATTGNNQLEIPLNELETGSYIYLISSPEYVIRGRVSVIK
ncbi:MAG: PKD domain-containing protein [Bacteroidales bacterium]|nr:PKD domain-containing protein [Bacteroidales bacterium]